MSRTLDLIGAGWASVRSMAAHGQRRDTLTRLRNLLARPELSPLVACEAHRLAGQLLFDGEKYRDARRQLRKSAELDASQARTFFLWGLAYENDPHGCDLRAANKYYQASQLEPDNASYRAYFGRAAIRADRVSRGVRELLKAAKQAPGDMAVIRLVAEGLIEARRLDEAKRVLNQARFRTFSEVMKRELQSLLERVRFESARCEQREAKRHGQDAELARDGGRLVLPFVTPKPRKRKRSAARQDLISFPQPHLPRLLTRKADR